MPRNRQPLCRDVRIGFTLGDESFSELLKVSSGWDRLLNTGAVSGGSKRICVWASNGVLATQGRSRLPWLCWHNTEVPKPLDRYVRLRRPSDGWSPWGLKSGPNFQFFRVLDGSATCHGETWLLLLELDTYPLNDPTSAIEDAIVRDSGSWMIGGLPHPAASAQLHWRIKRHLNGAALYNVQSRDFSRFRRLVWLPSLLEGLRENEALAFDCLTSPEYWAVVSPELKDAWRQVHWRFTPNRGIVNLSNVMLNQRNLEHLLGQIELTPNSLGASPHPWMLHAKTDDPDELLRALASHTNT